MTNHRDFFLEMERKLKQVATESDSQDESLSEEEDIEYEKLKRQYDEMINQENKSTKAPTIKRNIQPPRHKISEAQKKQNEFQFNALKERRRMILVNEIKLNLNQVLEALSVCQSLSNRESVNKELLKSNVDDLNTIKNSLLKSPTIIETKELNIQLSTVLTNLIEMTKNANEIEKKEKIKEELKNLKINKPEQPLLENTNIYTEFVDIKACLERIKANYDKGGKPSVKGKVILGKVNAALAKLDNKDQPLYEDRIRKAMNILPEVFKNKDYKRHTFFERENTFTKEYKEIKNLFEEIDKKTNKKAINQAAADKEPTDIHTTRPK